MKAKIELGRPSLLVAFLKKVARRFRGSLNQVSTATMRNRHPSYTPTSVYREGVLRQLLRWRKGVLMKHQATALI
jgi:hypothetical protein